MLAKGDVYTGNWFQWPRPDGEWLLRLRWAAVGDRMECISFEVWRGAAQDTDPTRWRALRGTRGPRAIKATAVRELPIATIIEQERARAATGLEAFADYWGERDDEGRGAPELVEYGRRQAAALRGDSTQPRPGRPIAWTDERLREVARLYREAYTRGVSPTKSVAQRLDVTYAVAAKRVSEARKKGFLGETTRGRAGAVQPPRTRRRTR